MLQLPGYLLSLLASVLAPLLAPPVLPASERPAPRAAIAASVAPDTSRCREAASFVRDVQRMVAVIDPDTIDDWRTGRRLAGCRVTAAGTTPLGIAREAVTFYERLRAAGWTRTPDPRDAPNEASLRFRRGRTDCVFNVYAEALLGTDAEIAVNEAVTAEPGASPYQVLVLCMPAMPASNR